MLGNRDRVLEVRATRTVNGVDTVSVALTIEYHLHTPDVHDRLDGEADTDLDARAGTRTTEVWYLRVLMNGMAHTMSVQNLNDTETAGFNERLYRMADIADAVPRLCCLDTQSECLACRFDQFL